MTLRDLSDLHYKTQCETSAAARTGYFKKTFTDRSESDLMNCIEWYCYLTKAGFFARTQNKSSRGKDTNQSESSTEDIIAGIGVIKTKPVFFYSSSTNGLSDMTGFFLINGIPVCVFCEIKIKKDWQKEKQEEFESKVNYVGGVYRIIKTFADFIEMEKSVRQNFVNL